MLLAIHPVRFFLPPLPFRDGSVYVTFALHTSEDVMVDSLPTHQHGTPAPRVRYTIADIRSALLRRMERPSGGAHQLGDFVIDSGSFILRPGLFCFSLLITRIRTYCNVHYNELLLLMLHKLRCFYCCAACQPAAVMW